MLEYKPDAILIGSQRGGTHFLRSYFEHHPGILWGRAAMYFSFDANYDPPRDAYCGSKEAAREGKCFVDMYECLATGFSAGRSPAKYDLHVPDTKIDDRFFYPDPVKIARRIQETLPGRKIIFIIRNQVDWIRANYIRCIRMLPRGRKGLGDFLSTLEGKSVLLAGMFHITIEAYCNLFGRERVHVMLLEDIAADQNGSLTRLCDFLGVKFVALPEERSDVNKGRGNAGGNIAKILSACGVSERFIEKAAPFVQPLKRALYGMRMLNFDVLTPRDRSYIRSFYAGSNYHTSKLLGIDLTERGYAL